MPANAPRQAFYPSLHPYSCLPCSCSTCRRQPVKHRQSRWQWPQPVRACQGSSRDALSMWESVAGSCRTHISIGEHHGRAAPSDLLGAPFTYITRMAVAVVWCRPSGAADRRRVLRGPKWATHASGRFCAAGLQPPTLCELPHSSQGAGSTRASPEAPFAQKADTELSAPAQSYIHMHKEHHGRARTRRRCLRLLQAVWARARPS